MGARHPSVPAQVPEEIAGLLSRRDVLRRATVLSLGGLVLSALPPADRILAAAQPAEAAVNLADATLQAVADTLIPGRRVQVTDLGHEIHPKAIAGAHDEPGAVETDALALFHNPLIGFDALEPAFLAEVQARSLLRGGQFLDLSFAKRVAVCVEGLAPANPGIVVWEAAIAVAFTSFIAAATQRNATIDTASGYQVMGYPGTAPNGYADYSYRRKLSREATANGSLP
ncbi:MAG: DUF5987 family protein [Solirubrobacterales bacterium]